MAGRLTSTQHDVLLRLARGDDHVSGLGRIAAARALKRKGLAASRVEHFLLPYRWTITEAGRRALDDMDAALEAGGEK